MLLHLAVEHVRRAEEPGDELGGRRLVDLLRRTDLLDLAVAHHGEPVGHRHGLFLVVGDVDERDPDLLLDALELQLHLLAELQVERAQRLVEQQHLGVVDQRAGQRHALLLAAGQLRRLAALEADQVDQLMASWTRLSIVALATFLRRRPKATFSKTFRCGNRA